MTVLVTGAAGFIGSYVCRSLLDRGESVLGIDNLNDYYAIELKHARLATLEGRLGFTFAKTDIADNLALQNLTREYKIKSIVHLAAQAGVRYSIENPGVYFQSNLVGHGNILELARNTDGLSHMVYASSSSVYGGNTKLPFSETDKVEAPVSLYAATKKSNELMSQSYAHLYGIPLTGLRFFTVYGPWGRPDMAYWLFTDAILAGRPIRVFNNGDMRRDFSYIDDIVDGILRCLNNPPVGGTPNVFGSNAPHAVYNIGNNKAEQLTHMIEILEDTLGKKAEKIFEPMQPGDVKETFADITAIQKAVGFQPTTILSDGLPKFVAWYQAFYSC